MATYSAQWRQRPKKSNGNYSIMNDTVTANSLSEAKEKMKARLAPRKNNFDITDLSVHKL